MGMHVQALVDAGVKAKDIAVVAPYNLQVSCPSAGIPPLPAHEIPETCRAKFNPHLAPTPAPLGSWRPWREELLVRCSTPSPRRCQCSSSWVWEGEILPQTVPF